MFSNLDFYVTEGLSHFLVTAMMRSHDQPKTIHFILVIPVLLLNVV